MKFWRSFKTRQHAIAGGIAGVLLIVFSLTSIWANRALKATASVGVKRVKHTSTKTPNKPKPVPVTTPPVATSPTPTPVSNSIKHNSIITTVFWVGESGSSDNSYIANSQSAWDEQWQEHYGGVDSSSSRNGYLPAGFTPKENPFYFALPYSDFTESGVRKSTANKCPNYVDRVALAHYSWCKNGWIAISYGNKVAYAQWQDVGPYEADDVNYVFGNGLPINRVDTKAGLDVSPAVRDYLGLTGENKTDWQFIPAASVPAGPWKNIVTTSKGEAN